MKKYISLLLSVLMALSLFLSSYAHYVVGGINNFEQRLFYDEKQFSDVDKNDWYYENIRSVYQFGLMQGKGNNVFDVSGQITIAETLAIAMRIHSIYYVGFVPEYPVESGYEWYSPCVNYAKENSLIIKGYEDYEVPITRSEFVKILAKSIDKVDFDEINYVEDRVIPDVSKKSSYYDEVYMLYKAGVIAGTDSVGTFSPDSTITRAEAATIVTRIIDKNLRRKFILTGNN